MRWSAVLGVTLVALVASSAAAAYSWPLKPFHRPHPIRAAFGDPRYHAGAEGQVSAFHFGVDIAARDGTPVYAVEPGYVHARVTDVTVSRASGHLFAYWHIRPVVHSGQYVHLHQLLGYIRPGWGHVHLAETFRGAYENPLRRGALTPFHDHTKPTIDFVELLSPGGTLVSPTHVSGLVDIVADAYDLPPIAPPVPWQQARLAPAAVWWTLTGPDAFAQSEFVVDFALGLPRNFLYSSIYAPGTYQNKPFRPGHYLFWLTQWFDTTALPDGRYILQVFAQDTRGNIGTDTIAFETANGTTKLRAVTCRPRAGPVAAAPC